MNRQQRRRFAKQTKGEFHQTFKSLVPDQAEVFDDSNEVWCSSHPNIKFDNPKHLSSERDKRLIASITLIKHKNVDPKTGEISYSKSCPRCHRIYKVDTKPKITQDEFIGLQGYTPKQNANI